MDDFDRLAKVIAEDLEAQLHVRRFGVFEPPDADLIRMASESIADAILDAFRIEPLPPTSRSN